MTAPAPEAMPDSPPHRHFPGTVGRFDESSRRLSHEELAVARLLVAEGHHVRSVAVASDPTPDLEVCGRGTEIKTLRPGATSATVTNALHHARRQGTDTIIDARASGLGPVTAERGIAKFAARADRGIVEQVRVLGAGYDRTYRSPDLDRWAGRPGPGRALSRDLG